MDEAPSVRLTSIPGEQGRKNDVIFCGTEAQQHVVFFHGDVQVELMVIQLKTPNKKPLYNVAGYHNSLDNIFEMNQVNKPPENE